MEPRRDRTGDPSLTIRAAAHRKKGRRRQEGHERPLLRTKRTIDLDRLPRRLRLRAIEQVVVAVALHPPVELVTVAATPEQGYPVWPTTEVAGCTGPWAYALRVWVCVTSLPPTPWTLRPSSPATSTIPATIAKRPPMTIT